MKAVVITEYGAPEVLKTEDRPIPEIGKDDVLVKVKAAGINRPDVFQRMGNYPAPKGVPANIPGLEIAGVIEKIGADVTGFSIGDKVLALLGGGGYAEYVSVPALQCLPIPQNLNFEEAASLPETIYTVYHNVFQRGNLQSGERILIHGGSSGIGITAIQLAKASGAEVIVTVGDDVKGEKCLELGADQFINYKKQDFEAVLKEHPVHLILDMIGGDYFQKNINILQEEGRLVYINAMNGNEVTLNIFQMMQKRLSIMGTTLRSRDKAFKAELTASIRHNILPLIETGKFVPVIYKVFSMEEAAQAHHLMESNKHIGKIILKID
ncbi:NAD(P)H-quinone oxidoreductase [Chryseobacterium oryzae]|uniref:NAD(P)H-quinone oxidoreductase n=1 Tax=Chryseobacterium oryzae TaxID=2929799 RepID=A0ABY4BLU0_9FLAO|nr:NAD(P)H-quinone oxidoreductase [Chryseobacterium oryzae]UOE37555.1 NAD(P)H-quinone oxidoreductase [Chryseobacterium oryzae]